MRDFKAYLRTGDPPHLMLIGPPGVGKNTLFWIFASQYLGRKITIDTEGGDQDYLEVNAGKDRGIETVRGVISDFAETRSDSFPKKKFILVDEAGRMTPIMQMALKHLTERHEDKCLFCFIMNNDADIIPPLKGRCSVFYFKRPNFNKMITWVEKIAREENIYFESQDLIRDIIKHYDGDFRRILVDCLEALRGYKVLTDGGDLINKAITEKDLYKIYEGDTRSYATEVYNSENPKEKFMDLWKKNNFDVRRFLNDYHVCLERKYSKTFAKIDSRLRRGANPMIQFSCLFDVIKSR